MTKTETTRRKTLPRILCISSGKGGVGKTSIAVNLAVALSRRKKRVLLIDGDLGLANVDIALGLNVRHTVRESLEEGKPLSSILVEITPGFDVLPASSGVPEMANLSYEEQAFLLDAVDQIVGGYDCVLVDTAAGIGDGVLWFNRWAGDNIVVLTPDPTSMTDAYALIKVLTSEHGKADFHLLVNQAKGVKEGQAIFDNMKTVLGNFLRITPNLLGVVPQDPHVVKAIRSQTPFLLADPGCKAALAVVSIGDAILAF